MPPQVSMIFIMSLGSGTAITFASSHWLFAWMGLEINTFSIAPLMVHRHHPRATEASTKYFIIQSTGSSALLFSIVTSAWLYGHWDISQTPHSLPSALTTLALALKMGVAPMHAWLPEVLQGLDLMTGLIMSTWQKLAPLTLLSQIQSINPTLITIMALTSILVGGWGGLNQIQLRKILAYSSIAHLGWMILVLQFVPSLTLMALLMYLILTSCIFLQFKFNTTTTINSLATSWTKIPIMTALTTMILLSLAGLPPLSGFAPKWLILQELTNQNFSFMACIALFSSLLSLYFYLRLSYTMTLTIPPNNLPNITPWRLPPLSPMLPLSIMTPPAIALLPLTPTIMTCFP